MPEKIDAPANIAQHSASGDALAVCCASVGVPRCGVYPVGVNPIQVIDCSPGRATDSYTCEGTAEALLSQIVNP